jgi:hypothetical protein
MTETEIRKLHAAAMAHFGTNTLIPHDDIIRFVAPDWDGVHASETGSITNAHQDWMQFRAWIRKQPRGVNGYRFDNVRGRGYMYVKA